MVALLFTLLYFTTMELIAIFYCLSIIDRPLSTQRRKSSLQPILLLDTIACNLFPRNDQAWTTRSLQSACYQIISPIIIRNTLYTSIRLVTLIKTHSFAIITGLVILKSLVFFISLNTRNGFSYIENLEKILFQGNSNHKDWSKIA